MLAISTCLIIWSIMNNLLPNSFKGEMFSSILTVNQIKTSVVLLAKKKKTSVVLRIDLTFPERIYLCETINKKLIIW